MSRVLRSGGTNGFRPVSWDRLPAGEPGPEPEVPPPAPGPETDRSLADASKQAQAILDAAERKAREIEAEALRKAAEQVEAARSAGYDEGKRAGLDAAQAEARHLVTEAERILEAARKEREEMMERGQVEMVQLALAVARKIVRHEVSTRPEVVADMVAEAVRRAREAEDITVRLHPHDMFLMAERKQELERAAPRARVELVADEDVEPGGCVVETERGVVDGQLGTQFARVEEEITGVVSGGLAEDNRGRSPR